MAYRPPYEPYGFAFAAADRNNDGVLDRNEFRNFNDFQNADRNGDGRVSIYEFANGVAPNLDIHPSQAIRAFQVADRDHDGVLDRRELADFSDFQHADLNHDGRIDPFEMHLFRNQNQGDFQPYSPQQFPAPPYMPLPVPYIYDMNNQHNHLFLPSPYRR